MAFESLPSRPLSHDEVMALSASGRFVDVRPVNAFHYPERETQLITAIVFVTKSGLRAVDYDPTAREWRVVREASLDEPDDVTDVPDALLSDVQAEIEQRVSEMEDAGVVGGATARDDTTEVRDATSLGSVLYDQYTDDDA
ncbi:hypothetical protein [Halarchaeum nitratireducens]|uniref:DUF7964 domain-containing protein n=1 Tax=Halarchaeum nitratireducens TaxID=489913 RepID=A0A830GBQ0_9EURY|nr:hypothetical protein [Halarchaeum nitratireducens]GGN13487.1 hypothetical protein GCM10009021_11990 [Halarchaeum nitratireducens]